LMVYINPILKLRFISILAIRNQFQKLQ